jgi:hypothetical protein
MKNSKIIFYFSTLSMVADLDKRGKIKNNRKRIANRKNEYLTKAEY